MRGSQPDLAAMGAGVATDGMHVAGVPVGVDAWVKTFVAKKARSVITDVAKLDVVSDGLRVGPYRISSQLPVSDLSE